MNTSRLLWALFLSVLLASCFYTVWKWEHETSSFHTKLNRSDISKQPISRDTTVWISPLIFPILILSLGLSVVLFGGEVGHKNVPSLLADVMLTLSIYFLFLLLILPLLRRFFSARACATMWLLPVFLFYQLPLATKDTILPLVVIPIPASVLNLLFPLWGMGFLILFTWKCLSHLLFRRHILKDAVSVTDSKVLAVWQEEMKRVEYYQPVQLLRSPDIQTPFSMGWTKKGRMTLLPCRTFTEQDLHFVFRHEICHIQRRDMDTKFFLAFCGALCWFNPLVWIAIRKASADLELSCDEQVLQNASEEERRQYASLLLQSAGPSKGFTTCLSTAAQSLRYRLRNVVAVRKRWSGTLLLGVSMFLFVMLYGIFTVSSRQGTVEALILGDADVSWKIQEICYRPEENQSARQVSSWNEAELLSILSQLKVEELNSLNDWLDNAPPYRLALTMQRGEQKQELSVYDHYLALWDMREDVTYYYLPTKPDWKVIIQTLK